jgi:fructokinase
MWSEIVSIGRLICVGETLWDVLPHGEFLGGAPLNVALHATRLGLDATVISRVGNDQRGRRAIERMRSMGVDTQFVQIDPVLPTGTAEATLGADGSASYQFPAPCAWDAIEATAAAVEVTHGAAVVYGTLAQRSAETATSISRLLDAASWRIFDANLRAPHDDKGTTLRGLEGADFVKLNEHEVVTVAHWLETEPTAEALWPVLQSRFEVTSLCITEGDKGARLWHDGLLIEQAAFPAVVADTIGAGDSFLSMLLGELLRGSAPADAMRRAARLAAFVASQPGASPDYDPADFRNA